MTIAQFLQQHLNPRSSEGHPASPVRVFVAPEHSRRATGGRPGEGEDGFDDGRSLSPLQQFERAAARTPHTLHRIADAVEDAYQVEDVDDAHEAGEAYAARQPDILQEIGMVSGESSFEQSEDQVSSAIDKANDPNFYRDPFSGQSYMPSAADRIETSEQLKRLLSQRPPLTGFALTLRINSILGAAKDRARAEAQATQQQNQGGGGDFFSNLLGGIAHFFEGLFSKVLGVFSQLLTDPLGLIGGFFGL
jgi:hypothetical protein